MPLRPAAEDLVREHGPTVFAMCRRLTDDPDDAYQTVWTKVLRALPRFDPGGNAPVGAWIATITRRTLVDRHRRRQVRGVVVPVDGLVADAPSADQSLDAERRAARLEVALQTLPFAQRHVVVQHHIHGVPLADLAREEDVAIGTIKSRLHRGRAALARRLRSAP
jgi:RNA polymerase sigma-70 factor (ECF subfamily)